MAAQPSELHARLIDLFGSPSTADPTKLYGNLTVAPSGNVLIGTLTDDSSAKLQVTGNISQPGTGRRFLADMTTPTFANRHYFQTSVANGITTVGALSNGTSTQAGFAAFNSSDPTNSCYAYLFSNSSTATVGTGVTGTGSYGTFTVNHAGADRMTIDNAGRIGFGKVPVANGTTVQAGNTGWSFEATDAGGQIRLMNGTSYNKNTILRDDGVSFYILHSTSNYGTWDSFRPFSVAHSDGTVTICGDGSTHAVVGVDGPFVNAGLCVASVSSGAPLGLRNHSTGGGSFWTVGPDSSNSFCIYNQGGVGMWMGNGGSSWNGNSDIRLKNIRDHISNAIDKVNSLQTITYTWKKDDDYNAAYDLPDDSRHYVGLIAQEVQAVQPEAVEVGENGYLGVAYASLVPLALAAIKELSAKLESQAAQISALQAQLASK